MNANLGTVVVDEETCDIYAVRMERGIIIFSARSQKRRTAEGKTIEDFVVFAPDGSEVLAAKAQCWVPSRKDGYMFVDLPVHLAFEPSAT